ncbi:uncharacterized protein LAESUDRAFT_784375 [Laetiporus sulphureus 93-53]|uniref:Uncharacterized protein n=1 Tax=Laetiporus sulphureus 93-53 TaxID=1314785 RepID=A0A165DES7_9APHY|nr:uncharacterized protein LAESUDRAFT_784375 [Laetiporus sulphureus 93-53]KZT04729.1 hypothetical protein LAESUDRAFT_784375 [Laetiporus sulphureus 93-53]
MLHQHPPVKASISFYFGWSISLYSYAIFLPSNRSSFPSIRHYLPLINVEGDLAAQTFVFLFATSSVVPHLRHHRMAVICVPAFFTWIITSRLDLLRHRSRAFSQIRAIGAESDVWNVVRYEFERLLVRLAWSTSSLMTRASRPPGAAHCVAMAPLPLNEDEEVMCKFKRPVFGLYGTVMGDKGRDRVRLLDRQ